MKFVKLGPKSKLPETKIIIKKSEISAQIHTRTLLAQKKVKKKNEKVFIFAVNNDALFGSSLPEH